VKPELKNEILFLYVAYFATVAIGLLPALSWYAVGALALQVFYAIIRYVTVLPVEKIFRSHAFNYILAVGVSFILGIIIIVQAQANGLVLSHPAAVFGSLLGSGSQSANSLGYVLFMMALEALVAVFWPIVLIARGLYLLHVGRAVFASGSIAPPSSPPTEDPVTRAYARPWLASAVMPDGRVVQFEINADTHVRVIGRTDSQGKSKPDIELNDETVSRGHARIELKNGSVWICDIGSRNGTFVNERQIGFNAVELHPSDRVKLGDVTLTISAT
jgi:FHA domain